MSRARMKQLVSAALSLMLYAAPPTLAQDCDSDGIPDVAEFGPFFPDGGAALVLQGSTGSAARASIATTDYTLSGGSFTIEFWLYRDSATGEQQFVLFNGNQSANQGLVIGFRADQRFTFAFWGNDLDTFAPFPPDGQWHHWVCRYDAVNNSRWIFRDGVEVGFDTPSSDYFGPPGPFVLGGLQSGAGFDGIIDELRIWDGARADALLDQDRFVQYDQTGIPSGLHAYYPFETSPGADDLVGTNGLAVVAPTAPIILETDCNSNGIPDSCDLDSGFSQDCNANGIPDECDITSGFSEDCNANGIPDECDLASGFSQDCNGNGIPDECDIASGFSMDQNMNDIPDECENILNLSQGTYWESLQLAVDHVNTNDTIEVQPGSYQGFSANGRTFTLRSADPSDPSLVNIQTPINLSSSVVSIYDLSAADIVAAQSNLSIHACNFVGSSISHETGFYNDALGSQLYVERSRFIQSPGSAITTTGNGMLDFTVRDSLFAGASGAAIEYQSTVSNALEFCVFGSCVYTVQYHDEIDITNNLFINNAASVLLDSHSDNNGFLAAFRMKNNIILGTDQVSLTINGIGALFGALNFDVDASVNLVEGGLPGISMIIDDDPMFVDPDGPDNDPNTYADNDYMLLTGSPCIDMGTNSDVGSIDLAGNPRIVGGVADLGPYEYQGPPPCPADLTGDGQADFFDVSFLLQNSVDYNGDTQFDFFDISAFLQDLGAGCP